MKEKTIVFENTTGGQRQYDPFQLIIESLKSSNTKLYLTLLYPNKFILMYCPRTQ